jgi:hypothetical protein
MYIDGCGPASRQAKSLLFFKKISYDNLFVYHYIRLPNTPLSITTLLSSISYLALHISLLLAHRALPTPPNLHITTNAHELHLYLGYLSSTQYISSPDVVREYHQSTPTQPSIDRAQNSYRDYSTLSSQSCCQGERAPSRTRPPTRPGLCSRYTSTKNGPRQCRIQHCNDGQRIHHGCRRHRRRPGSRCNPHHRPCPC